MCQYNRYLERLQRKSKDGGKLLNDKKEYASQIHGPVFLLVLVARGKRRKEEGDRDILFMDAMKELLLLISPKWVSHAMQLSNIEH